MEAWEKPRDREEQSKKIRHNFFCTLEKEPYFPPLYTQSNLYTCVKQSWKNWHSVAGFSNQLFKLMLVCDTLLLEMWKENARSCRNFRCIFKLFLPEAWTFYSDREKNKSKGFYFLNSEFSDIVHLKTYQWQASGWISMNSNNEMIKIESENLKCLSLVWTLWHISYYYVHEMKYKFDFPVTFYSSSFCQIYKMGCYFF